MDPVQFAGKTTSRSQPAGIPCAVYIQRTAKAFSKHSLSNASPARSSFARAFRMSSAEASGGPGYLQAGWPARGSARPREGPLPTCSLPPTESLPASGSACSASASRDDTDFDRVSANWMAFHLQGHIRPSSPSYVVNEAITLCDELAMESLAGLTAILKRHDFRKKLAGASVQRALTRHDHARNHLPGGIHAPHRVKPARCATCACRRGASSRRWGGLAVVRCSPCCLRLPEKVSWLELETPRGETDILSLAEALHAANGCAYCGTAVVDTYAFAEAATHHYGCSGDGDKTFERIEHALLNSGVDTGGKEGNSWSVASCAGNLKDYWRARERLFRCPRPQPGAADPSRRTGTSLPPRPSPT